jgi:hypothetical protein
MTDHVEDKRREAGAHLNCGDEKEATTIVAQSTHHNHAAAKPEVVGARVLQLHASHRWPRQAHQPHHPGF